MEVTLGGDRLGSGNKQKVKMHNYQMSSFNQEQDFKSSLAPGVLYPFIKLVGTNHGTFDIDLDSFVRTLPTRGPLFGSFKLQVDMFSVPMRLYQAILHNNPTKIGMKMNQVYLPKLKLKHIYTDGQENYTPKVAGNDKYCEQINNSSLLKYLGFSGIGTPGQDEHKVLANEVVRKINAIPALAYYDIFKCYYSNKQEENAYVIIPGDPSDVNWITRVRQGGNYNYDWSIVLNNYDPYNNEEFEIDIDSGNLAAVNSCSFSIWVDIPEGESLEDEDIKLEIAFTDGTNDFVIGNIEHAVITIRQNSGMGPRQRQILFSIPLTGNEENQTEWIEDFRDAINGPFYVKSLYVAERVTSDIKLQPFALENIDNMRTALLSKNNFGTEFKIGEDNNEDWTINSGKDGTGYPYTALTKHFANGTSYNQFDLNGLVVKTYQSDLFNNWLDSEWIDGEEGIAALTAISTQDGKFTIDSFVFAEKLYDIYNRIATGGGTYEDWQEACYGEGAVRKAETPMYIGGMSAEVMFEEVISSAETNVDGDRQALGSLGGKGTQVSSKGGHNIHVKCEEPSYVIGIVSLTPRICYSQGNDWDLTELDTMDDLHKPGLDGIGFQDLIVEQMAWWDTRINESYEVFERSAAGKQTAWINYQTAVDKCYGDFAKQEGYSFMVLNRNYEMEGNTEDGTATVKDISTYIDPSKYNYAFAYDALAAQNFWVQIHSKVISRRKMGAQQIPNL